MHSGLSLAAEWIANAREVIAFTGAGVSTESGIPDFRSANGIWLRYDPYEYATLSAFKRNPEKVWKLFEELADLIDAKPNPGHRALAELEAEGGLAGIITQNVDGLHQAAGSRHVVEFHGSHRTFGCLTCGARYAQEHVFEMEMPPRCTQKQGGGTCDAILKPDTVLFDEMIPDEATRGSRELIEGADLVLVIGSSCEVMPAALIPQQVRENGGRVIELNLDPARSLCPDLQIIGKFSEVLPKLVARWREIH